ncbi:MAG: AraC family transcriptional regulator [Pseudomonadota bacterium]
MDIALSAPARLPLERFSLFDSHDLDEARDFVGRVFCPHELSTSQPRRRLDARHHSARLADGASLNYVQYGPEVDIRPGYLKDFFLLQIPLRGGADVRCGAQQMRADVRTASLPSPTEPLAMRWADDSPHLILKLSRTAMQTQLEQLAQRTIGQPLVFDLAVRLDTPALAPLLSFIQCLRESMEQGDGFCGSLLADQAESYLMSSLLLCTSHNHSAALQESPRRALLPRAVRRAQEYMTTRLDAVVTLADLCSHVGVSARALQAAFRAHGGQSPMEFLRNARLDRIRSELRASSEGDALQVAQVAARYGFLHAGRFSTDYRQRFGESPSHTLRARGGDGPARLGTQRVGAPKMPR